MDVRLALLTITLLVALGLVAVALRIMHIEQELRELKKEHAQLIGGIGQSISEAMRELRNHYNKDHRS